ncbi:MAG: metallophosphoesterase [Spirochaetes bacterium]|nr:metallophosphoesterase [Spirochaetota bacterium]
MSRLIVFKLVFAVITIALLAFQVAIWKKIKPKISASTRYKLYRFLYYAMVISSQTLMWVGVFYPGRGLATTYPEWYEPIHRVLLAITYSHAFWLFPLALFWLLGMGLKRILSPRLPLLKEKGIEDEVSRADFLRKAGGAALTGINLLPAVTSVAAISGMFLGSREIWVNQKTIRIKNLHDDLKGLKIAQISDIHIGNLIGERYLHFAQGLIRAAKVDYIVATGDILDNNNAFLPTAAKFFADLEALAPGRLLASMGNHDYIDDGAEAARTYAQAGARMLVNDSTLATRGRGVLQFAGLDYPPMGKTRSDTMRMYFAHVQKKLRSDIPVVLLNHHPSDFEYLKTQRVDLVLSGHTHGGQVQLSSERNSIFNSGHWLYKYYIDHYEENGAQLYVNRGLGHWFPLRVQCPPEITVFTLV